MLYWPVRPILAATPLADGVEAADLNVRAGFEFYEFEGLADPPDA